MPSIKIAIDLTVLRLGHCGLWEYAYQFGKHIIEQHNPDEFDITFIVPSDHPFAKESSVKFKEITFLDRYIKKWCNGFDLFHAISFPSPYMPYTRSYKGKLLATLHDLNFVYEKSDLKIKKYLHHYRSALPRVDRLVCISNFTMNDAKKYLDLKNIEASVIYNGVNIEQPSIDLASLHFPVADTSPYLLSVSTFMRKKNLDKLIPMMACLPNYKLIIAGKIIHKDYYAEVQSRVKDLGLEQQVFFVGEVTDEEKYVLYKNCAAYVFPSFAEGFGIPPIEAMLFGKPVFVSDKTSIPEICGKIAFYWTNFEPLAMAKVFTEGMCLYEKTQDYADRLKQFASRYSWADNVDKHLQLYREISASQD